MMVSSIRFVLQRSFLLEPSGKKDNDMKRMILTATTLLLVLSAVPFSSAETISAEKRADIERLLQMTGALDIGKQMSEAMGAEMSQAIKAIRPDLPPKLFDIMEEEVNQVISENLPNFVALVIPVYARHFTHEEIRGLIKFYQTDVGKKAIRVLPTLMQEGMLLGQQWGNALVPEIQKRVLERFKAEGVDLTA